MGANKEPSRSNSETRRNASLAKRGRGHVGRSGDSKLLDDASGSSAQLVASASAAAIPRRERFEREDGTIDVATLLREYDIAKRCATTAVGAIASIATAWDGEADNVFAASVYYEGVKRGFRLARVQCANELGHLYNVLLKIGSEL